MIYPARTLWFRLIASPVLGWLATTCVFATESDPGIWAIFAVEGPLQRDNADNRWLYQIDVQARYFDLGSGVNQWLVRPAIGYKLSEQVNGWFGYARFRTSTTNNLTIDEDRLWQQLDWSGGTIATGKTTLRGRLEERFVSNGDDTALTLRLMVKYVRSTGYKDSYFLIGIEPFLDFLDTDWGGPSGLSQNRAFAGLGMPLNPNLAAEISYMNQYFSFESRENQMNNLGVIQIKGKF
jgi:hypothetical protein